jgi:hypothetical protein
MSLPGPWPDRPHINRDKLPHCRHIRIIAEIGRSCEHFRKLLIPRMWRTGIFTLASVALHDMA